MSLTAMVTMVLVCGMIWGGFALLVVRAVRRESRKTKNLEAGVESGVGTEHRASTGLDRHRSP